jgi:hypothetical protein
MQILEIPALQGKVRASNLKCKFSHELTAKCNNLPMALMKFGLVVWNNSIA